MPIDAPSPGGIATQLSSYAQQYDQITSSRPDDAVIDGQVAKVEIDGTFTIIFSSQDLAQLQQLFKWIENIISLS